MAPQCALQGILSMPVEMWLEADFEFTQPTRGPAARTIVEGSSLDIHESVVEAYLGGRSQDGGMSPPDIRFLGASMGEPAVHEYVPFLLEERRAPDRFCVSNTNMLRMREEAVNVVSQPEETANEDQLTLITLLPTKTLSIQRRGCLPLQYLREEFEVVEAQFLFLSKEMKDGYCLERHRYVEEVTNFVSVGKAWCLKMEGERHAVFEQLPRADSVFNMKEGLKALGYGKAFVPLHPYPHRVDASQFWAVLIGIDAYRTHPSYGCVSDALTMENYLIKDLRVPQERIQRLLGPTQPKHESLSDYSAPSRANIVSSLLSLASNPKIKFGDNIIIYISGHGTRYCTSYFGFDAETEWIEALCPIDRGVLDTDGILIPDISDRELNAILLEIARNKGHHITVILDCCCSGSLTRNIQSGTRTILPFQGASLKGMLEAADEKMKSFDGYRSILAKDWRPDMTSHVVLAACKANQSAKEVSGEGGPHGVFTQALLGTLRSNNLKDKPTYLDVHRALPCTTEQEPVVAGDHKDACIWYQ